MIVLRCVRLMHLRCQLCRQLRYDDVLPFRMTFMNVVMLHWHRIAMGVGLQKRRNDANEIDDENLCIYAQKSTSNAIYFHLHVVVTYKFVVMQYVVVVVIGI